MKTWKGSCHCASVEFEVATDEPLGPYFRCNCSLCSRKGAVIGAASRAALRVTKGAEALNLYQWNTREAEHYFCRNCGIYTHHVMRGHTDTIGINMACLEGVDVFNLSPVTVDDGATMWSLVPDARDAT